MKVELNKEEMSKEQSAECNESLIDGPQVLIICHCCGAAVFVDVQKIIDQMKNDKKDDGTQQH